MRVARGGSGADAPPLAARHAYVLLLAHGHTSLPSSFLRAMRPVKGDGNCFYRAYMFAIFESVLLHPSAQLEAKTLIDKLRGFYDQMISPSGLGYQVQFNEYFQKVSWEIYV